VPGSQTKKSAIAVRRQQLLALDLQPEDQAIYIPALTNCGQITQDPALSVKRGTDMARLASRRRSSVM